MQESLRSRSCNRVLNAMTIDVEEYFQVSAFDGVVPRARWPQLESRVCASTDRLLDLFAAADVTATFFVLGWVAERHPALVRRIGEAGHELASHGHDHRLIYTTTPEEFRSDLRRSRRAIEDAAAVPVIGYRAPSFSITKASIWALDILIEEGYRYDASIYPVYHDRYGIPSAPRHVHRIERRSGAIWELPGSTVRYRGTNFPIGGGGYFRLLPYPWTRRGIRRLNEEEGQPAIFYLHPWEIDPEQPRMPLRGLSRIRHYRNLEKTEHRLQSLVRDFRFGSVREILASATGNHRESPPASASAAQLL